MGPVSADSRTRLSVQSSVYGSMHTTDGNLEEAYITYDFGNGFSVTGGRNAYPTWGLRRLIQRTCTNTVMLTMLVVLTLTGGAADPLELK